MQYTVQGQRADTSGPLSPVFTVNFGRAPDGMRNATVSTTGNGINAVVNEADRALVNAIVNSTPHNNGKRTFARS